MARNPRNRGSYRTLMALGALLVLLFGGIFAAHQWAEPKAQLTPLLGLDLAGGRQIIIEPVVQGSESIQSEQVDQAIDIIRNRIDGSGVAEAEVARLGGSNIVVSIPGNPTPAQMEALSRSSQLRFRAVLVAEATMPTQPPAPPELPLPDGSTTDPADGSDTDAPAVTDDGTSEDQATVTEGVYPESLLASGAEQTEAPGEDTEESTATEQPDSGPTTEPASPSDLAWVTPELQAEFDATDCADQAVAEAAAAADPAQPVIACSVGGLEKYILGPSELSGGDIADASAGLEMNQAGTPTGRVEVRLSLTDTGREAFAEVTTRLFGYPLSLIHI